MAQVGDVTKVLVGGEEERFGLQGAAGEDQVGQRQDQPLVVELQSQGLSGRPDSVICGDVRHDIEQAAHAFKSFGGTPVSSMTRFNLASSSSMVVFMHKRIRQMYPYCTIGARSS